jgi:hypothetical protein
MYKPIYNKDGVGVVSLEEVEDQLFVHVVIDKPTRSSMEELLHVWADIKAKCYWLGYEHIYAYTQDDRMEKFFPGSEYVGEVETAGLKFRVLQWELN